MTRSCDLDFSKGSLLQICCKICAVVSLNPILQFKTQKKYFKLYSVKVNGNEPNNWPIEQELDGHNSWPLDHNAGHKPRLWSCCLRSRGAGGRLPRWTELTGTGAATSGSPLAAPDLSTQTPCRETKHRGWVIPSAPERVNQSFHRFRRFDQRFSAHLPREWLHFTH